MAITSSAAAFGDRDAEFRWERGTPVLGGLLLVSDSLSETVDPSEEVGKEPVATELDADVERREAGESDVPGVDCFAGTADWDEDV